MAQNLRLDRGAFKGFTTRFVEKGIRLLVPEMMERELLRHFAKQAETEVDELRKRLGAYPNGTISLPNLASPEILTNTSVEEKNRQWWSFKEHFVVESLTIGENFESPVPGSKTLEYPDGFILMALERYHKQHHANIAVISRDVDLIQACGSRDYLVHFPDLTDYVRTFLPELAESQYEPAEIDVTRPIATEDLTALKAILARGDNVTPVEFKRVMRLLEMGGTNYDYFFQKAESGVWLNPLREKGHFSDLPARLVDGSDSAPVWPPLHYLVRIFESNPAEVLDIIDGVPNTNNVWILEGIFRIVLSADSAETVSRFHRFVLAFIEHCRWGHELVIELLRKPYLFEPVLLELTPVILLKIVEFRKDPREDEKRTRRLENPQDWGTCLKPVPKFDQWAYQEILEKGVRSLADQEPYQVARTLIDAVASMIRFGMYPEDLERGKDEDISEIWCRRLDVPDREFLDVRESLVQTLTYACEKVYENAPEAIDALEQTLGNQRWKVFKRLRQHLYACYPNEQTHPWIRDEILARDDYDQREHHYEFQLMVRKASERFGPSLLTGEELGMIVEAIRSGPSRENFREWFGDGYSDEAYHQHQRSFHRKQLRPFATLLSGDFREYFEGLEAVAHDELNDEIYSPYRVSNNRMSSSRSPMSLEELQSLSDESLLTYLNDWNDEHHDERNWLIEVSISALAAEFQSLAKDHILPDEERLSFWLSNRERIARPIYVVALVKAMIEQVKEQRFGNLGSWTAFCNWVLTHPDGVRIAGQPEPQEESSDHPDWTSSRRAVIDLVSACLSPDHEAPIRVRNDLLALIRAPLQQSDWRLDHAPVLIERDSPIADAINSTRGRALESAVNFGFWVRRQIPEDDLADVKGTIQNRMENGQIPLTLPEHALLGMHFGHLCRLDGEWAAQHRPMVFPQPQERVWRAVFCSYIRFNHPSASIFEILKGEFLFALDNLHLLQTHQDASDPVDRLGQHLFTYYLWALYPVNGSESLLEHFYEKTKADRKRWAKLFNCVGRSFAISGPHLSNMLVERAKAFFDWRYEAAELLELQEFTYWLQAECLPAEWRLQSFSKILDIGWGKDFGYSLGVRTLNELLPNHLGLVVECFAKITDSMKEGTKIYISPNEAKPILKAGLETADPEVREKAERARENLLRLGYFQYLDI